MHISVNWLRDFVDVPQSLNLRALAERFTLTCAEVEGVEEIHIGARGLIAARVLKVVDLPKTRNLRLVSLDIGGKTVETVSAAPVLHANALVVYAPPGAETARTGRLGETQVAGRTSVGMILAGEDLGVPMAALEAIFCPPAMSAGDEIRGDVLDDWIIEVDNKSITHRPDLWGHYGVAREFAAMLKAELKPYPVTPLTELQNRDLPEIEIEIDDPQRCPRYSALRLSGVGFQPAPLAMQFRLGHVGMRPIDCLVDLSNYIMCELGQPTHAFDGEKLQRIEVGSAKAGSKFTTLDGVERELPDGALMICCKRKPVALAGIMGGLETEVAADTTTILLESANFEPSGIRKCAAALSLRTEASARFEKSLDPAHTVLAIQRFVTLARQEFPNLQAASTLSDAYPRPAKPISVEVDTGFVRRFLGHEVSDEQMTEILERLEFTVTPQNGSLRIGVPSFRATKDISIEADIIEEIARSVGYDNFAPSLPEVAVRHFPTNAQHRVEKSALRALCEGCGYAEIHRHIWYDAAWLKRIGFEPPAGVELRNPAATGEETLRHTLMPGMLEAVECNRLYEDAFKLLEIGTVFPPSADGRAQRRMLGLVSVERGKKVEDDLFAGLKGDVERWVGEALDRGVEYRRPGKASSTTPWIHPLKTAEVVVDGRPLGLVSVAPLGLRKAVNEHLAPWGIAWAELDLGPIAELPAVHWKLRPIPEFPEVELDFSMLVAAQTEYGAVNARLATFAHPLLRRIQFVTAFEGGSVPAGKRSLTYRCRLGAGDRTLSDEDISAFRQAFHAFLDKSGFTQR